MPKQSSVFDRALHALHAARPSERQAGLMRLGLQRDPRAWPHFHHALGDRDPLCRYLAVQGLLGLGAPSSVPALQSALVGEPDAYNRVWMRMALLAAGQRVALKLQADDIALADAGASGDWDAAPELADRIAEAQAADDLGVLLDHPNAIVRWIGVMALARIGTERAVAHLQRVAQDADAHVRAEAVAALGGRRTAAA